MYVYSLPPIDYFDGLTRINKVKETFEHSSALYHFLSEALLDLLYYGKYWSMDKEGASVFIGTLPIPYNPPSLFLVIKQCESGGNGSSYIVSDTLFFPNNIYAEYLSVDKNNINKEDLYKFAEYLSHVFSLVN